MEFIKNIFRKRNNSEENTRNDFNDLVIGNSVGGKSIPGAVTGIQIMIAEKVTQNEPIKINLPNEAYTRYFEPLIKELKIESYIVFNNDRVIIDYNLTKKKIEEIFII